MNVGKAIPQEDKEKFLKRNLPALEWMFEGDNFKHALKTSQLLARARKQFKYSEKTNTCDIFFSLQRAYRKMKDNELCV